MDKPGRGERTARRAHPPCPTRQGRGRPGPRAGTRRCASETELTSLRGRLLPEDAFALRRDQPEVAVPAPVDHVDLRALRPGENEEVVVGRALLPQGPLDALGLGKEPRGG